MNKKLKDAAFQAYIWTRQFETRTIVVGAIVIVVILSSVYNYAFAHGDYGTTTIQTNTTTEGMASALALGQCQYDYSHFMQGCVSIGHHDGTQAGAFGLGTKLGDNMLISGGVAIEEGGDVSGAGAINFKFK